MKLEAQVTLMKTPERSRDERKRVEMRFAHLKTHHRFEHMRLRGLSGARDEFHLAAVVQNLKTLAKHIWRPPLREPTPAIARTATLKNAPISSQAHQSTTLSTPSARG